jgi:dipeptidyl aminopeptidase/acylaminoacyl peptidase
MRSLLLICLLALSLPALADTGTAAPTPVVPGDVLRAGPVVLRLPAFHDADRAGVTLDDLLAEAPALPGNAWPAAGDEVAGPDGSSLTWSPLRGAAFPVVADESTVTWTAFYVTSDRWQKALLTVVGPNPVEGVLDGAPLTLAEGEGDTLTADLTLTIGKHLVVLRTRNAWLSDLSVTPDAAAGDGTLALSVSPDRTTDIGLVLHSPRVGGLALAPDGRFCAVSLSGYRDGEHRDTWLEIRDTDRGDLVAVWRGGEPQGLRWLESGNRLSWSTVTDEKTTIWLHDLDARSVVPVLENVADMGSWRWAPDGTFLVYEVRHEPEADERRVKRVHNPADRQPWYRNRSHLVQAFVPGGYTRRLTAGPVSPDSWRIAPDGGSLLFFLSEQDLSGRPFFTSELWLMDLETLQADRLLDDPWVGGAEFSPDGTTLLLAGSPSAFDGLGRNLPEGVQANDYGGQLYLWSFADRQPRAITRDFRPDVGWSRWSAADGHIYAVCTDTQFNNVYRLEPGKDAWERVETGFGYTDEIELPRRGNRAVARGTSGTTPSRVHRLDLKKNRAELLHDPGAAAWADVSFGRMEPWVATLPNGEQLDGRVYYPPHFDPARSYPVIVYYYGGTSPVTVDFGGRYPKNVWAAQDYIVYVPQPSGALGYGQEMAARHVNDWGRITAMEVIEGTKAFLAEHADFVDPQAVGCIGASYGGFLTMYITTQTDLFAAAVSHAGISSISSYWGEGLWGYAYGTRALADAFPWNDRELYVGQSALFHADRINTPLLLVHGDSDTNVPVGESDQLFTALKLLGREVEYVQIVGQDHWIQDHEQRLVWNDTIMAFFARHLKQRAGWWDALYPAPEDWR